MKVVLGYAAGGKDSAIHAFEVIVERFTCDSGPLRQPLDVFAVIVAHLTREIFGGETTIFR